MFPLGSNGLKKRYCNALQADQSFCPTLKLFVATQTDPPPPASEVPEGGEPLRGPQRWRPPQGAPRVHLRQRRGAPQQGHDEAADGGKCQQVPSLPAETGGWKEVEMLVERGGNGGWKDVEMVGGKRWVESGGNVGWKVVEMVGWKWWKWWVESDVNVGRKEVETLGGKWWKWWVESGGNGGLKVVEMVGWKWWKWWVESDVIVGRKEVEMVGGKWWKWWVESGGNGGLKVVEMVGWKWWKWWVERGGNGGWKVVEMVDGRWLISNVVSMNNISFLRKSLSKNSSAFQVI